MIIITFYQFKRLARQYQKDNKGQNIELTNIILQTSYLDYANCVPNYLVTRIKHHFKDRPFIELVRQQHVTEV